MYWLISVLGAALVGALLVYVLGVFFGRGDSTLGPAEPGAAEEAHWHQIRNSPLSTQGINSVQFSQSFRGYNAAEVDAYLERLSARIAELEDTPAGEEGVGGDTDELPHTHAEN